MNERTKHLRTIRSTDAAPTKRRGQSSIDLTDPRQDIIDTYMAVGPDAPLGRRIFALVLCEPFEEAIASLAMAMFSLLMAEAEDPVAAFDGLALRMRAALIDAKRSVEADRSVH